MSLSYSAFAMSLDEAKMLGFCKKGQGFCWVNAVGLSGSVTSDARARDFAEADPMMPVAKRTQAIAQKKDCSVKSEAVAGQEKAVRKLGWAIH